MKITFKNVGQGDSILIEWSDAGANKIGIIDCNKPNEYENPVLTYLKGFSPHDIGIEFIILSHPHYDHFSGLLELLEYCQESKITIRYFLHTCASVEEYLLSYVKSVVYRNLLLKIFQLTNLMYEQKGIIEFAFVNNMTSEIQIAPDYFLKFLYPSTHYYNEYNKIAFKDGDKANNPNANLLCTVICISNNSRYGLLTSDAVQPIFRELERNIEKKLNDDLCFAQIPHHGSKDNFHLPFWEKVFWKKEGTVAGVSVGPNNYNHPDNKSMNELTKIGYQVKYTNNKETSSKSNQKIGWSPLDLISAPVVSKIIKGQDISFEF